MWYVIQTENKQEELMRGQIAKALADVCPCELFVPKYVCKWKHAGEWLMTTRVLFPGYVFLDFEGEAGAPWRTPSADPLKISDTAEICEKRKKAVLKRLQLFISHKAEPVCIGGGFYPIRPDEQAFFEGMMTPNHEIGNSVGDIIGGKLIVHSGPLQNHTDLVTFIDRHKCIADVRTSLGRLSEN